MAGSTHDQDQQASKLPSKPRINAPAAGDREVNALKTTLQEQRRALTLVQAELEKEREMREALQMQLIEANAEIVASWDRRKEMARVIGDRDIETRSQKERIKQLEKESSRLSEMVGGRDRSIAKRDEIIKQMEQKVAGRDRSLANRDKTIAEQKAQIQARFEELAALQRHMIQSSLSAKAKRLARQLTRKKI